jgi:hypothetical protein
MKEKPECAAHMGICCKGIECSCRYIVICRVNRQVEVTMNKSWHDPLTGKHTGTE